MIPAAQYAEIRRLFYAEHWRIGTIVNAGTRVSTVGLLCDPQYTVQGERKPSQAVRRLDGQPFGYIPSI